MSPIVWVPGMVTFFVTLLLGWRIGFGVGLVVWIVLLISGGFR